jgi:hypothetical protein
MKYIKTCLFFLGVLLGMALMGFFGLIGFIGVYGVVVSLWEYCPEILVGLGMFVVSIMYVPIGWSIFCKCADKLKDS